MATTETPPWLDQILEPYRRWFREEVARRAAEIDAKQLDHLDTHGHAAFHRAIDGADAGT